MDLQIENGNFTRISNDILDSLVKVGLLGSEFSIVIFVIRKTYGFQKTEDISLSQFQIATGLSRVSVVKAIKILVNRDILVKVSLPNKTISYKFNKYADKWKVVNRGLLVNQNGLASKLNALKLVKGAIHTKETTKETIQKKGEQEITPKEKTIKFFTEQETREKVISNLLLKGVSEEVARREIQKFINWWTESNGAGTKQKWQMQETFEINKRLVTWFNNIKNFKSPFQTEERNIQQI